MSLSGGTAGGKGVDSNAVDTYDSGDEWDIGVGNLIIDLDADLEKDKLEMSVTKDGMAVPPSAVAALPDNIRFVSPVAGSQGKESKSKYKRSKNSKDNSSKASSGDGGKKETTGRTQSEPAGAAASTGAAGNNATSGKNMEKGGKAPRGVLGGKKDKEGVSGKSKKDKSEGTPVVAIAAADKDVISQSQVSLGASRSASFDNTQSTDLAEANPMGNIALESVGIVPALTTKTEPEEVENGNGECKTIKKVKNEKVRSLLPGFVGVVLSGFLLRNVYRAAFWFSGLRVFRLSREMMKEHRFWLSRSDLGERLRCVCASQQSRTRFLFPLNLPDT